VVPARGEMNATGELKILGLVRKKGFVYGHQAIGESLYFAVAHFITCLCFQN